MHVGAVVDLRGPAAASSTSSSTACARGCTWSRATARSSPSRRGRPAAVDRRSRLQPRVPRAPDRAARAGLRGRSCMRLAARIMSQQLDRTKPLWEVWLVEGLDGDRLAMISKTHHALIDGVSGVDLATVMFDLEPVPPMSTRTRGLEPWTPAPEPSAAELVAGGAAGLARRPACGVAARRARRRCAPAGDARAGPRGRRGPRRDRLGGPEPGARDPAERRDRPAPPVRRRALPSWPTSRRSRTRSAARSTTSC